MSAGSRNSVSVRKHSMDARLRRYLSVRQISASIITPDTEDLLFPLADDSRKNRHRIAPPSILPRVYVYQPGISWLIVIISLCSIVSLITVDRMWGPPFVGWEQSWNPYQSQRVFSATRSEVFVANISSRSRWTDTGRMETADYLEATLRDIATRSRKPGVEIERQTMTVFEHDVPHNISNVILRYKGALATTTDSCDALLLAGRYDTRFGAIDSNNAAAISMILETFFIVSHSPVRPHNSLIILLADGNFQSNSRLCRVPPLGLLCPLLHFPRGYPVHNSSRACIHILSCPLTLAD